MFTSTDNESLVYALSRWERYNWQEFREQHGGADNVIQQGTDKVFSFPQFAAEVFHRLYASDANRVEQPRPEAAWAVRCHDQLSALPEFIGLEHRCDGDRFLSGMAATAFIDKVAAGLPAPKKPLSNPQQLRDQIKALKASTELASTPELQQMIAEMQQQGKAAVEASKEFAQAQGDSEVRVMLRAGCEAAEKMLDSLEQLMSAYGWGDGFGSYQNPENLAEKMAIAKRLSSDRKLKEIAALAGRMKQRAAAKQRSKAKEAYSELSSVELGNDLGRLLPTELMKLGTPETWVLFAKDYTERSLQQYKLSGKDTEAQGPVVVCLDTSGSMGGTPEIWSKAVALTMLAIATHQKRHCRILHFNSGVVQVDDFPPGESDPNRLLNSMAAFYGGGTSWEAPLDSALQCIRNEKGLKKADIVLITDGACQVSNYWKEQFKVAQQELEFTVYGVLIGCSNQRWAEALGKVADKTIVLPNLSQDAAIDLVFEI